MTAARTPETYKKAMQELDGILKELEAEDLDVDGLEVRVKQAAELIKFCKARLDSTELKIKTILDALESDEGE